MNTGIRESRVLRKLRAGKPAISFKLNLDSARAAELAAWSGFDCIWADMEHTASDWSLVEHQIWAAKSCDCDVLVRVARGGYSDYIRPLELDAAGIMVPHIMSVEDAKQVVRTTKFHPSGLRPIDGGNADGRYAAIGLTDYIRQCNEQRFVAIQIEDVEPLDQLEEIIALDGVDVIFFGPADFSQSLGAPGVFSHPEIGATRKRIAELCRKHGKYAGTPAVPETLDELVDMGYMFLNVGADVVGLQRYCADICKAAEKYLQ